MRRRRLWLRLLQEITDEVDVIMLRLRFRVERVLRLCAFSSVDVFSFV